MLIQWKSKRNHVTGESILRNARQHFIVPVLKVSVKNTIPSASITFLDEEGSMIAQINAAH